jgi:hypothetical protein
MSGMMSRMAFKPRDLKQNVETEPMMQKVRIVGFSVLMATIAGTYETYFANIVYRSNQMQDEALAGKRTFLPYTKHGDDLWKLKNTLAVLEAKPWKELKYISMGWADHTYTDGGSTARAGGVQDEYPSVDNYFTQTERYQSFFDQQYSEWQQGRVNGLRDV